MFKIHIIKSWPLGIKLASFAKSNLTALSGWLAIQNTEKEIPHVKTLCPVADNCLPPVLKSQSIQTNLSRVKSPM